MTVHEHALALLAEVNPPVAAALDAVGCNRVGHPSIGLLGWLPDVDRLDACRAVLLAHRRAGTEFLHDSAAEIARELRDGPAAWLSCDEVYRVRRDAGVVAFAHARREDPDVWLAWVVEAGGCAA